MHYIYGAMGDNMKTFEYSTLRLNDSLTRSAKIEKLSEVGAQGWELVSIIPDDEGLECYFKKETDTVAEQAKEKLDDAMLALRNLTNGAGQGLGSIFSGLQQR